MAGTRPGVPRRVYEPEFVDLIASSVGERDRSGHPRRQTLHIRLDQRQLLQIGIPVFSRNTRSIPVMTEPIDTET